MSLLIFAGPTCHLNGKATPRCTAREKHWLLAKAFHEWLERSQNTILLKLVSQTFRGFRKTNMLKIASASTFLLGVPQPYYAGTTTEASFQRQRPLFCGDQKGFRSWSFFVSWTNRIEIASKSHRYLENKHASNCSFTNFPQDSLRKVCQKSSLRFLWWLLQVIHIETELHCRTWRKCFRFFVDTLSSRSCYDKYPTIVINGFWWSLSDTGDTLRRFFSLLPKRQSDRRRLGVQRAAIENHK